MVDTYPLSKYFDNAAADLKKYAKDLSNDVLKPIYGLYKQATVGDNNTEAPSFYKLTEKGKWNAWNEHKGKSTDQAKHEYVSVVLPHLPDNVKANYQ